jgi:hypothetical protein
VFRRGSLAGVDNLMVLGVTHPEAVDLPHLDLEIWGRAHRDYGDMVPLETVRPAPHTLADRGSRMGTTIRVSTAAWRRVRPG